MKAYELATDATDKLRKGDILEEKKEAYYSTPRGQNFLRREADAADGLEREQWLILLRQGEATRNEQLKAYRESVERKDTSLKENLVERGKSLSKYGTATGMAGVYLLDEFPELKLEILSDDTIHVEQFGKILVLPPKYQHKWGETQLREGRFLHYDSDFAGILNDCSNTKDLRADQQEVFYEWFADELHNKGYVAVASVNSITQDVAVMPLEDLTKAYTVRIKKNKRLGGTTNYLGSPEELKPLLEGTPFEKGKVLFAESLKKTIIIGVPRQAQKDCHLDGIYLGYRNTGSEEYFEVRRKHVSTNYDVFIALKAIRVLTNSGIENELKKKLREAEQDAQTSLS